MAKNLAGKTFEVFTADGNRWIYDSTHEVRSAALQQAETLLAAGGHDGVRVVAESERTGEEEVLLEERSDRDKVITLVPVDEAPVCENLNDFFRFPARRTAGRLLRNLLNDQGISALEFGFNPGQLMMFERNDKIFPPAMHRIAAIQAREAGAKHEDRLEFLYRIFENIKERAKAGGEGDAEKYAALLKSKGLNSLVEAAGEWEKEHNRDYSILGALAAHITGRADWDGKLKLLINLSLDTPSPGAVEFLDEITAEILDGAEAVMQVLGGQPDTATANRMLINLSQGQCPSPKKPISCLSELNNMIFRLDMPLVEQVLLERVQNEIGGVRRLTREGREVDRDAFVGLARSLAEGSGILGGADMCEALVKRARITLPQGETDLSVEQAIDHLLDLLPNRAVRLGFLLDLAASALGGREEMLIMEALDRISKQLSFLASLIPDVDGPEKVIVVVNELKQRLSRPGLPEGWRKSLAATLDGLINSATGSGTKDAKKSNNTSKGNKDMADPTGERKTIKAGEIVFEEGDKGDIAYLIFKGQVEIFRASGNQERILATLGRGEIIGEMALIDNQPRVASARALEDTEVSLISQSSLRARLNRLEESDRVLRRLIDVLVSRIRGQAESPE